jgi:Patatin-like phospholipase
MASLMKLHEVLEQEYVSMYGPLAVPAELHDIEGEDEKVRAEKATKRLDNVIAAIHARGDRSALCISGGGIRSATFALGIIQGLAKEEKLREFDYLSTVSGGGYIGSWLSSWIRRDDDGVRGVETELAKADTDPANAANTAAKLRPKLEPEPVPLRHLRAYSNYLSPRLGLLSGDSWTLAAMYIRNLLLNLLVIVPLLAAILAIPRAFSWLLEGSATLQRIGFDPIAFPWMFAVFATIGFAYLGNARPIEHSGNELCTNKNYDTSLLVGCVLMLSIAGVGLAATWARWNQYDLESWTVWGAAVLAVLGMTVVPYHFYYRRLKNAHVAQRRAGYVDETKYKSYLRRKKAREAFAVSVALLTSLALWFLLAYKVFDDPLRATPQLAKLPPLLRFFVPNEPQAALYVCLAVPLVLLVFFVQASIFVGLSSTKNQDSDREWWARGGAWLLFAAVAIGLLNVIAVFGPMVFYYAPVLLASVGGVAGVIAALFGFSDKTPANQKEKEEAGAAGKAGNFVSALAVPIFVVLLLTVVSFGTTWIVQQFGDDVVTSVDRLQASMQSEFTHATKSESTALTVQQKEMLSGPLSSIPMLQAAAHLQTIQQTNGWQLLILLGIGAAAVGLSFVVGVNKFSMNALYRNRLIRAYLGASRWSRKPDPFTGFDDDDNLAMWALRQELLWSSSIVDIDKFVDALSAGKTSLAARIWSSFDEAKQALIAKKEGAAKDILSSGINQLLIKDNFDGQEDKPGGYSRSMRNRMAFDKEFRQWVRPMAQPRGVKAQQADEPKPYDRAPMHVVNIALNLTSGENLAWQQRMASSLTVSPMHVGNLRLGYRDAREYGGPNGISLGTAVSISGAAASPNMGYHSSPTMAFLLTFFNIRLGAWLGNPGSAGEKSFMKSEPTTNLTPFAKEATGSSNDKSPWVYLSDGGHFENLALYEMVLRRCHHIVLSDGGCDPAFSFEDFGNAIRKIRIDLGIPIEVTFMDMQPRGKDGTFGKGQFVARATIRYSAIDQGGKDGELIYIKSAVYDENGTLPKDIYNYARESLLFPHEPTSDQFFSESQFESYRALGRYAVNGYLNPPPPVSKVGKIPIKAAAAVPAMAAPPQPPQRETGANSPPPKE